MEGHRSTLGYHARLVGDLWRVDAYERALRRLVVPGQVVLDLGTGTGILAMLAARLGARVHAVESMAIARTAAKLFAHNKLDVQLHHAGIGEIEPVEPVDLIVSDFLGVFLVDDRMLPAVEAAGKWLAPGGRFCPSEVTLYVAPVGGITLPTVELWREPFYGIDLSPLADEGLRLCSLVNLHPSTVLAPAQRYHTFVPPGPAPAFDRTLRFTVDRPGRLRALAGWFTAALAPDVTLTTAPGHETHWGQHLFPLPERELALGAIIEVRLWLADDHWNWTGTIDGEPFAIEETLAG